jgi:hypothetical protein
MDDVEPQIETDPCLASCCQRELNMNRLMRERGENVRMQMPASLVNRTNGDFGQEREGISDTAAKVFEANVSASIRHQDERDNDDDNDDDTRRSESEVDSDDIDA